MSAELSWAIKTSFLRYVESAGGSISLAPPAAWVGDRFVFPRNERGDSQGGVRFAFEGEVAIRAYGGLLDVQIADLTVLLDGDRGIVSAATLDRSRRYDLAHLTRHPAADTAGSAEFDAALHEGALALFGGVYPPGTELDTIFLSRDNFE